jgi:hypothetical protein
MGTKATVLTDEVIALAMTPNILITKAKITNVLPAR